jgi:hypothetical protein
MQSSNRRRRTAARSRWECESTPVLTCNRGTTWALCDYRDRCSGALAIGLSPIAQSLVVATASTQQQKPNILFILADNAGYGDISVYGGGVDPDLVAVRWKQFRAYFADVAPGEAAKVARR